MIDTRKIALAQRLLTDARLALEKENIKLATWCVLDAVWYLLESNVAARKQLKLVSDMIYPKGHNQRKPGRG